MLLLSLIFFTVGTILCSVAHNFTVLLAGRAIQGIGGGGIITITQVIFCDIVPLRQRPKYFAMVLGSWSIGSIVGPVVGGALVENASWRWCFHINYPFCGIGFVVAACFVRMNATTQLTISQKLKQTDWIGAFIFIGSFTSFLIGLSFGGVQNPWTSAATLAPLIVGVAGITAFLGWQVYKKPHSLLPMSIFYNWSAISAFYCAMINGLVVSMARVCHQHVLTSSSSSQPSTTFPSFSCRFVLNRQHGQALMSFPLSVSLFRAPSLSLS